MTRRPRLDDFPIEMIPIEDLKPHPLNYVVHPQDQIDQLKASIKHAGVYKNVVVAKDGTLLAGHGLTEAMKQLKRKVVPGRRLPISPMSPAARRILAGDNMIPLLAERDDRAVSQLMKGILEETGDLEGTGLDAMMLANLVFVTRPASEIQGMNEAAHWVGLPEYPDADGAPIHSTVNFLTEVDREKFAKLLGVPVELTRRRSMWWPPRKRDDLESLKFKA